MTDSLSQLADDIARARTFAELSALRTQLKQVQGIDESDRGILSEALLKREGDIIRLLLPHSIYEHAKTQS